MVMYDYNMSISGFSESWNRDEESMECNETPAKDSFLGGSPLINQRNPTLPFIGICLGKL